MLPLLGSPNRAFEQLDLDFGFLDGSPCIFSYRSQTRAITSISMLAEMSGNSSAAAVPKRMKQAIINLRVGGRCFFSIREMTSARFHPKRCASSPCESPERRRYERK